MGRGFRGFGRLGLQSSESWYFLFRGSWPQGLDITTSGKSRV